MGAVDAIKLNLPFLGATKRIEGGSSAPIEKLPYVEQVRHSTGNPFDNGNLVGVNTNIGIGDIQDGPTQAGYKLGGRTIAFG